MFVNNIWFIESANASKMNREGVFSTFVSESFKNKQTLTHTYVCTQQTPIFHLYTCKYNTIFSKQNTVVHAWLQLVFYMKNNGERKNKLAILCLAFAKLGEENFCTVPCHVEQYETPPNFIKDCFSYFWDCLET